MPQGKKSIGAAVVAIGLSLGSWSECSAVDARFDSIGGVATRVDLGVSVLPPDLDGTRDYTAMTTVTGIYQSMLGMTSYNKLGVLWGVGIGGQFGALDDRWCRS